MRARRFQDRTRATASAFIWLLLLWITPGAQAHSASTAYLASHALNAQHTGLRLQIALRDLDAVLDLDSNADGALSWGEVLDHNRAINAYLQSTILLSDHDGPCALRFGALDYSRHDAGGYAAIEANSRCDPGAAMLHYRVLDGVDPSHRALLRRPGVDAAHLLAPDARVRLLAARSSAWLAMAGNGFEHILGGFDHLMFLLALMLPAVVRRESGRWLARERLGGALAEVAWISTAFTLAHSLTLGLAAFDILRVSANLIEPLIAATVLATALNNVWPVVTHRLAFLAFAFGLIHGFGFAEVLMPLSLSAGEMARALLAFNLGVEAAQLCVVAFCFVILAALRRLKAYPGWILRGGSIALAALASVWLLERVLDVSLISRVALAAGITL